MITGGLHARLQKRRRAMGDIETLVVFTGAAGACIPLGGVLARVEHIRPRWLENEFRHFVIAFGGGILLAVVALVLVPEGIGYLSSAGDAVLFFLGGGLFFFWLERLLGLRKRESPQFSAMLLDYIPESLALGGIFAVGSGSAPLLALFIGLQNLPEGFNAFREMNAVKEARPNRIIFLMCAMVPLGPVFGTLGWLYFAQDTWFLGAIMLFASGGILYLVFQDIAPQSRLQRHWAPPLGAVAGFSVGILGQVWLHQS